VLEDDVEGFFKLGRVGDGILPHDAEEDGKMRAIGGEAAAEVLCFAYLEQVLPRLQDVYAVAGEVRLTDHDAFVLTGGVQRLLFAGDVIPKARHWV
jgi:hypothetical protein